MGRVEWLIDAEVIVDTGPSGVIVDRWGVWSIANGGDIELSFKHTTRTTINSGQVGTTHHNPVNSLNVGVFAAASITENEVRRFTDKHLVGCSVNHIADFLGIHW